MFSYESYLSVAPVCRAPCYRVDTHDRVNFIVIITPKLAWVHLPKTAGTTTDELFQASGISLLWRDSQSSPAKHLPPSEHPSCNDLPLDGRQHVTNFRRLPHWLLSNYHHKLQRMKLELDSAPMRDGLFWRERAQQWLPADWWIERFGIDEHWIFLRVEDLKSDFLSCLSFHEPIGRIARWRVRLVNGRNRASYSRSIESWFTPSDLEKVYSANPRWTSFERQLYGDLLI